MVKVGLLCKTKTQISLWENSYKARLFGELDAGEYIVILEHVKLFSSERFIIFCSRGIFQTSDWPLARNFEKRIEKISK